MKKNRLVSINAYLSSEHKKRGHKVRFHEEGRFKIPYCEECRRLFPHEGHFTCNELNARDINDARKKKDRLKCKCTFSQSCKYCDLENEFFGDISSKVAEGMRYLRQWDHALLSNRQVKKYHEDIESAIRSTSSLIIKFLKENEKETVKGDE